MKILKNKYEVNRVTQLLTLNDIISENIPVIYNSEKKSIDNITDYTGKLIYSTIFFYRIMDRSYIKLQYMNSDGRTEKCQRIKLIYKYKFCLELAIEENIHNQTLLI
jgi:hypothetical protein